MEEIKFNTKFLLIRDIRKNVQKLTKNNYPHLPGEVLLPNDTTYIHRQADEQLFDFLQNIQDNREVAYIFAAAKMGKSSLIFSLRSKLSKLKYICVGISCQNLSPEISESSFYQQILQIIYKNLKDKNNQLLVLLNQILQNNQNTSPYLQFIDCLKAIIQNLNKNLIIFLDDVEAVVDKNLNNNFCKILSHLPRINQSSPYKIKFVLSGDIHYFNFFEGNDTLLDQSLKIEVKGLNQTQCKPLIKILKNRNAKEILSEIITWTGGQPFLIQILCQIVYNENIILEDSEIQSQIEQLVKLYCCQPELLSSLNSHFKQINDYFFELGKEENNFNRSLLALNLYHRLLTHSNTIEFSHKNKVHYDLLASGLVIQSKGFLVSSNLIYAQVFNQAWILKIQHQLNELRRSIMPSTKIYNRKVYMLIDQSGSMASRDPLLANERRWIKLQEFIEGHVYRILSQEGMNGEKICDEITISVFSPNRPGTARPIQDDSQVAAFFRENQPDGNTFIVPTLNAAINDWLTTRQANEGGFIIIYTDGELDDRDAFERLIRETCQRLNNQDELKVIIIGYGSDIVNRPNFYLRLDANTSSNVDRNGKSCNIVVFDTFDKMPNIIDVLNSQLENPDVGLVEWGREYCPELYD